MIALDPENHRPIAETMRTLRIKLHHDFPDMSFYFASPDIVSQILNFGIPAPIDIQVTGRDPKNYDVAKEIEREVAKIPGAADVHVHQVVNGPELRVNVDRTRAGQIGLTQQNVASTMLISLSSSGQSAPNYWLNFKNGVNYSVAVQTPQYKMDSLQQLKNTPIAGSGNSTLQLLSNLATIERRETPVIVNHYNVQPVYDILTSVQDRDLGGVADDVQIVGQRRRACDVRLDTRRSVGVRDDVADGLDAFVGQGLTLFPGEVEHHVGGFAVSTLRSGRGERVPPEVLDVPGILAQLADDLVVVLVRVGAEGLLAFEDDHHRAVGVEFAEVGAHPLHRDHRRRVLRSHRSRMQLTDHLELRGQDVDGDGDPDPEQQDRDGQYA